MTYVPHTDADRRAMLDAIGSTTMEELFEDVPEAQRFPDLALPLPVGELEVERELGELAARNTDIATRPCFLGAGTYRHHIPATVDAVLRRGELFTSYTPYQPELSQGMLQATFEYQSMLCALTGMEVSTAGHYEGATALAEAVLLALSVGGPGRRQVVVPATVDPRYRQVLATYLQGTDATVQGSSLEAAIDDPGAGLDETAAAVVVQSPNFFGHFEDVGELADRAHEAGALLIVVADPVALGRFRAPGEQGADVVVADGQSLGLPPSFGGPRLGILTTREEYVRRTAGRLVGETVDGEGRRGYVLTLATREQHIRRERATSNICTNAALMAVAVAVHLATLGKSGLREVAEACYHKSHYAASRIGELPGFTVDPHRFGRPFFKEFAVRLPRPVAEVNARLLDELDIVGGYDLGRDFPGLDNDMLVAVTEVATRADIDRLVDGLAALATDGSGGS